MVNDKLPKYRGAASRDLLELNNTIMGVQVYLCLLIYDQHLDS